MIESVATPITNKATPDTRWIFLVDGSGALLSAFFLGIIIAHFENIFGLPRLVSYLLASIAALYSIYSFFCYFNKTNNWQLFLKFIIIANLFYCCLTIGFVIVFYQSLTILGLIYFIMEIVAILALVVFETRTLRRINLE